jgi:hypothetical protein
MRFVISPGHRQAMQPRPSAYVIKAVARAHRWKQRQFSDEAPPISAIARDERMTKRYVARIMRLAFLAPDIVEAILDGRQPADLELECRPRGVPAGCPEQRRALGFARD